MSFPLFSSVYCLFTESFVDSKSFSVPVSKTPHQFHGDVNKHANGNMGNLIIQNPVLHSTKGNFFKYS